MVDYTLKRSLAAGMMMVSVKEVGCGVLPVGRALREILVPMGRLTALASLRGQMEPRMRGSSLVANAAELAHKIGRMDLATSGVCASLN